MKYRVGDKVRIIVKESYLCAITTDLLFRARSGEIFQICKVYEETNKYAICYENDPLWRGHWDFMENDLEPVIPINEDDIWE